MTSNERRLGWSWKRELCVYDQQHELLLPVMRQQPADDTHRRSQLEIEGEELNTHLVRNSPQQ